MISVFGYLTKDIDEFSVFLEGKTVHMNFTPEREKLTGGKKTVPNINPLID